MAARHAATLVDIGDSSSLRCLRSKSVIWMEHASRAPHACCSFIDELACRPLSGQHPPCSIRVCPRRFDPEEIPEPLPGRDPGGRGRLLYGRTAGRGATAERLLESEFS